MASSPRARSRRRPRHRRRRCGRSRRGCRAARRCAGCARRRTRSARRRCGRCPCGSRWAAAAPAASPAAISGVPGPASAIDAAGGERDPPPVPLVGDRGGRAEPLDVQRVRVAGAVPVLGQGVEQAGGAAGPGLAGGPVGHGVGERVRGRAGPRARCAARRAAGRWPRPAARSSAPNTTSAGVRSQCTQHRAVEGAPGLVAASVAQHAHDRGDAAARRDEQQLLRHRVGQHELAGRAARAAAACRPGCGGRARPRRSRRAPR